MNASHIFLGFLSKSPNYGYELKKLYDKYFGADKPILSGQVYSTLSRLKRDNEIEELSVSENESDGPERVQYAITTHGKETIERWLQTAEPSSPTLQATMYVKTVLAVLRDGDAALYLDRQRRLHLQRMRDLTHQRLQSPLAEKLLIDHAIYHIEADLRWIDLTVSRLTQLKTELTYDN